MLGKKGPIYVRGEGTYLCQGRRNLSMSGEKGPICKGMGALCVLGDGTYLCEGKRDLSVSGEKAPIYLRGEGPICVREH